MPQEKNMPGEVLSPTQPFPTKPAPFDYQRVTIDDLVDFTPEIRAMAVEAVSDPRRHRGLRLALRGGIRPTTMRPRQTGSAPTCSRNCRTAGSRGAAGAEC